MKVTILIATHNGGKYLIKQLNSLISQTYKNIKIIARDDKSTDKTLENLSLYDIELMESKSIVGAKKSFSYLLKYALQHFDSDYFMFCDQDDVWEDDKVEKTLKKMQELEVCHPDKALLVHTDLEVVDEDLNRISSSFMNYQNLQAKHNSLNRLLIQNNITGCTVMINKKTAELCVPIAEDAMMHDQWIALVVSQFGYIGYIDETLIKYRQHSLNSIGAQGFNLKYILDKLKRQKILEPNIQQAKVFLSTYISTLDSTTIEMLEDLIHIESKSFWQRRKILLQHKLLKQGLIRNIGLLLKV